MEAKSGQIFQLPSHSVLYYKITNLPREVDAA